MTTRPINEIDKNYKWDKVENIISWDNIKNKYNHHNISFCYLYLYVLPDLCILLVFEFSFTLFNNCKRLSFVIIKP